MKTYHFDVFDGETTVRDEEGQGVVSLAEVRKEAVESVRELIADLVLRGERLSGREMRVRGSAGEGVLTMQFSDLFAGS